MTDYIYKKVKSLVFSMLNPEDLQKMSSVKIITAELYDKEGYPVDGGLMDIRLGVIDPGLRCKTCGGKLKECMGHFGHIELARPVIHVLYADIIQHLLASTCGECHRILFSDDDIKKHNEILSRTPRSDYDVRRRRIKYLYAKLKLIKKCPHCSAKQHPIKIEKPTTYMENDRRLSPIEVRNRLSKISDADCELLGLDTRHSRPEWMILTTLPIPPVTMRPSITLETGERSEDDLTHKLGDIVRINQRLFENINAGAPEIIVEDLWDLLQYHITTYFDNTLTNIPPARHRSGQELRTLVERIKSKEGRFRHNLVGKRVNFAARTVISPDPRINFDEVGIPKSVAMELTLPEMVTEWNKEWLIELVKRGPDQYPGANYVITEEGKKKKITAETVDQLITELKEEYLVERHLINGDLAIFNRQPSLHRICIMFHRIIVLPGLSFRLNPSVCNPYNADFDGDEMNLHVPQTKEAQAEAEILMQVQTQLISPKNGYNVIGCVEDSITGNYLLTKYLTLSKEDATNLLLSIGIDNVSFDKDHVNGREIVSALFPEDFNFAGLNKKGEMVLDIKNGKLLKGVIDQNAIGEDNGELLREFYRRYGKESTFRLMDSLFRLGIKVLLKTGFTTGIHDTDITEDLRKKIQQLIVQTFEQIDQLIQSYEKKTLEMLPGKDLKETLEARVLELLNKVRNKIGDIVTEHVSEEHNPTLTMARSGARGNTLNFVQMSSCVGQQALGGQRIMRGYKGRSLSLFTVGDLGPAAHGFITNSFKSGLNPYEFFFHAMTGRDALMDTALRTPKSGYLYRRLANALQDLKVEYDNTLRNADRSIIQFTYGDDAIDVSRSEGGKLNVKRAVIDHL